jgi:hypothetical protein
MRERWYFHVVLRTNGIQGIHNCTQSGARLTSNGLHSIGKLSNATEEARVEEGTHDGEAN